MCEWGLSSVMGGVCEGCEGWVGCVRGVRVV